jgi:hypothetical protein
MSHNRKVESECATITASLQAEEEAKAKLIDLLTLKVQELDRYLFFLEFS